MRRLAAPRYPLRDMDRRTWLQLLTVLSAARSSHAQEAAPSPKPPALTKDELTAALKLMRLEFTGPQLDLMLPEVNKQLAQYQRLREIPVPLDTEPAVVFHPGLPGKQPVKAPARFVPLARKQAGRAVPTNLEDLCFLPVTELAPLVRARKVSSTDLTKMYLARLKRFTPKLNCVISLTEEIAFREAAQADAEIRRGRYRGPLHGIPYGLKDLFAVKGTKTTWGAEPFKDQTIDVDSTVYRRLHDAGAVLVAKLSMGALAMGGLWFGGMTKTPWNLEQSSSGSSAGSAAATAAGLVGFAIGTETLGSIVTPSIRCGVVGLRPTYGRVSRHGAMGLSWTMDKIGPICRSVEDCALVLNALYGPDGHDQTVTQAPLHWEPRKPLSSYRIGFVEKAFQRMEGDQKEVYARVLEDLRKAGVRVTPVELPDSTAGPILSFILSAEAGAAFDDITRDGQVDLLQGQKANDWPNTFRSSRLLPAVEYVRAQRARRLLVEKMEAFFDQWDAVVCPPYSNLTSTNLTGHPQVVLPCGFLKGMPQGLSVLAPLWQEGNALRVALAFEQATDWHKQQPDLQ